MGICILKVQLLMVLLLLLVHVVTALCYCLLNGHNNIDFHGVVVVVVVVHSSVNSEKYQ